MMFGFILESSSQHRQNTLADRYGLDVFPVPAYRLGDCNWPEHLSVHASFVALPFAIFVLT
jgi:hypothetical protein